MAEAVFETEKHLRTDQPEVILGHGTEGSIAGMDADAVAAAAEKKLIPGEAYHLVFMACKAGMPLQQASSLAGRVYDTLTKKGIVLTIEAPKAIALILDNQKYLVTEDYPRPQGVDIPTRTDEPMESPDEATLPEAATALLRSLAPLDVARRVVLTVMERLLALGPGGFTNAEDAASLKTASWTKKAVKAKTKNSAAVTPFDVLMDAIATKRAQVLTAKDQEKLTKAYAVLATLEASAALDLQSADDFEKWVADIEQAAVQKRMTKKVETRESPDDSVSSSIEKLDPSKWETHGKGGKPQESYFS